LQIWLLSNWIHSSPIQSEFKKRILNWRTSTDSWSDHRISMNNWIRIRILNWRVGSWKLKNESKNWSFWLILTCQYRRGSWLRLERERKKKREKKRVWVEALSSFLPSSLFICFFFFTFQLRISLFINLRYYPLKNF